MNPIFIAISAILCIAQLTLPRKYAFAPLLIAGAHLSQTEILPELSPARIIILIGIIRAAKDGHLNFSIRSISDRIAMVFAFYFMLSSIGHDPNDIVTRPFVYRTGFALNVIGTYIYGKSYIGNIESVKNYAFVILLILIPLSVAMTHQKKTGFNPYSIVGSSSEYTLSRDGELRASGPFRHAILAGCCGATALPFALLLLRQKRKASAIALIFTATAIVFACSSSGPIAAIGISVLAIPVWYFRHKIPTMIVVAIMISILYGVAKGRAPWFIMSGMDFTGNSTGWHRAELISQSLKHLDEWFLFGSDYTRHWMSSGMRRDPNHSDLTNYYIYLGVLGGLPSTLCFMSLIAIAFKRTYQLINLESLVDEDKRFAIWTMAVSLAAHALSLVSIAYFDQMYIFLYISLGSLTSLTEIEPAEYADKKESESDLLEASVSTYNN